MTATSELQSYEQAESLASICCLHGVDRNYLIMFIKEQKMEIIHKGQQIQLQSVFPYNFFNTFKLENIF